MDVLSIFWILIIGVLNEVAEKYPEILRIRQ